MQQNLNYAYPQIFWVDAGNASPPVACSSVAGPPPVPLRKDVKRSQRRDNTSFYLFIVFLLVLLALTGVGVGTYKILQMQDELAQLKELTIDGRLTPALKKHIGFPDISTKKRDMIQAAHLTGKENAKSLPLEWEDKYGRIFTSGVQYKNTGLVVNETGLYFVYSMVYFRWTSCENNPLIHTVFKRIPRLPTERILMEGKKTNYCADRGMWARNSYLGAVFNLTRSDSLHVNVSDVKFVGFEESKTFFGLYKL
ncbi:tumor necrosis factor ligand superfamily member 6 [Microcaecilia unicolor]|uniref:Tumor necrosis factor ligand superfamily member 6 n=1 Tax=Microcaecilia unicolor TaxID=1415580 RepID=A0A6P7YLQ0_9AMPH|nr:tumor necrosis factor ligand superfamily member 6 [Microcaecilia unicolor]